MTIHLIESWERPSRSGANSFITVCGEVGEVYGTNFKENATCEDCLKAASRLDEFGALPQTEWEEAI